MHIPQSMLHGNVCPLTLTVSMAGVSFAAYVCHKSKDRVPPLRWAGVSALILGMQMLNFPVTHGTSGHLMGGILAVSLLGIPRAVLSMAMVLATQAFFLGDGGVDALGANILNMALIATGVGGLLLKYLMDRGLERTYSLAISSMISVLLAALACIFEVISSGAIAFGTMAKAMLPIHMLIGIAEAILTVILYRALVPASKAVQERTIIMRTAICCLAALAIAPFASGLPDGLEWVIHQLDLTYTPSASVLSWFKNYQITAMNNPYVSTFGTGLLGLTLVWLFTFSMAKNLGIRRHIV